MPNALFVYGTLAPNRPNHHIMTPINNGEWFPAYAYGELLADGWGASLGYPAMIPNDSSDTSGQKVAGFIFKSEDLINHWARLDDFEGEGYQRVPITAYLENDEPISAFVYALAKKEIESFKQSQ